MGSPASFFYKTEWTLSLRFLSISATKKGAKTFFFRKNMGGEDFFSSKKGGGDFFRQILPKTRPRYPVNFDRSLTHFECFFFDRQK